MEPVSHVCYMMLNQCQLLQYTNCSIVYGQIEEEKKKEANPLRLKIRKLNLKVIYLQVRLLETSLSHTHTLYLIEGKKKKNCECTHVRGGKSE